MNIYKESLVHYMVEYDGGFYSREDSKCYSMARARLFENLSTATEVASKVNGGVRMVKVVDIGNAL